MQIETQLRRRMWCEKMNSIDVKGFAFLAIAVPGRNQLQLHNFTPYR